MKTLGIFKYKNGDVKEIELTWKEYPQTVKFLPQTSSERIISYYYLIPEFKLLETKHNSTSGDLEYVTYEEI